MSDGDLDEAWVEAGAETLINHKVSWAEEPIALSGMFSWDELVEIATVVLSAAYPLIKGAERDRLNGVIEESERMADYWQERHQRAMETLVSHLGPTRGGSVVEHTSTTDTVYVFPAPVIKEAFED